MTDTDRSQHRARPHQPSGLLILIAVIVSGLVLLVTYVIVSLAVADRAGAVTLPPRPTASARPTWSPPSRPYPPRTSWSPPPRPARAH